MKKKTLIITALVLAATLAGGIWWYASRPAPVEEPEDQEITANSEPAESTPETEEEEPEPAAPEESAPVDPAPEDDPYGIADMTPEELEQLAEEADRELEAATGGGTGGNQQQQPSGNQQQQQPSGNQQTMEEFLKEMEEAGLGTGTVGDNRVGGGSTAGDGSQIHW